MNKLICAVAVLFSARGAGKGLPTMEGHMQHDPVPRRARSRQRLRWLPVLRGGLVMASMTPPGVA